MTYVVLLALGILFVAFKLIGAIDWSWWLVLMPFYIGFMAYGVFYVAVVSAIMNFGKPSRRL